MVMFTAAGRLAQHRDAEPRQVDVREVLFVHAARACTQLNSGGRNTVYFRLRVQSALSTREPDVSHGTRGVPQLSYLPKGSHRSELEVELPPAPAAFGPIVLDGETPPVAPRPPEAGIGSLTAPRFLGGGAGPFWRTSRR